MKKFFLFAVALNFSLSVQAQTEKFSSLDCIPVPAVCYPLTLNTGSIGMTFVSLNQIQNTSGNTTTIFENYTCTDSTQLDIGTAYTFHATTGQTYEESITAWIDFNNNGDFDSSEIVFHDSAIVFIHMGTITIPFGVQNQNIPIRMRVGSEYSGNPILTGCNNPWYGEYEDYKVYYGINNSTSENESGFVSSVFPNPFTDYAQINFENVPAGIKNCTLNIYNITGALMRQEQIENTSSFIIHRKELQGGMYYFFLRNEFETLGTGKIIIY